MLHEQACDVAEPQIGRLVWWRGLGVDGRRMALRPPRTTLPSCPGLADPGIIRETGGKDKCALLGGSGECHLRMPEPVLSLCRHLTVRAVDGGVNVTEALPVQSVVTIRLDGVPALVVNNTVPPDALRPIAPDTA